MHSSYGKWLRNCNRYWYKLRDNLKKPSFLYPCMLLCPCMGPGIMERLKEWETGGIRNTSSNFLHSTMMSPYTALLSSSCSLLGLEGRLAGKKNLGVAYFPLLENFTAFILPDVANSKKSSILLPLFLPLPHTHSAKASCKSSLLYLTGICFNFHLLDVIFGNIRRSHINNLMNQNINFPQTLWAVL